jgi:hypothetical protein
MSQFKMFELIDPLEAGKSARAKLMEWDGERYVHEPQSVRVHDFIGAFGCRGHRGYCFLSNDSERWEVDCGLLSQAHQPML